MAPAATHKPTRHVVVDIGNSGVKWFAWSDAAIVLDSARVSRIQWENDRDQGKISYHGKSSWGAHVEQSNWPAALLEVVLADLSSDVESIEWWISSVHRGATSRLCRELNQSRVDDQVKQVTYRDLAWQLDVDFPEKVGIDRVLAAWEVYQQSSTCAATVVVQAGTAVTVDLVTDAGTFGGGAILPGLPLALRLLTQGTDLLPSVQVCDLDRSLPPLPGKNSEQAMLAGVVASVFGGIDHLVERYNRELARVLPVVVSGGNRWLVARYLRTPHQIVDHLVLRGLLRLCQLAHQNTSTMKECCMSTPSSPTLYERIGGQETVDRLIIKFYENVFSDPELAPFFSKAELPRLTRMQQEFFSAALDGPVGYSGNSLVAVHHGRGIQRKHFTRFVEHLLTTLGEFNLDQRDIDEVIGRISTQVGRVTEDTSTDG